jgi:signal transduction histidine kinase
MWERWWFLSLVVAGSGLIAYAVLRYRLSRVVELANVRARIALDLHDDIGSNLTKISILSEVAQQDPGAALTADGPLASIARISRESVAAMSDIVWAANPHRDRLVHLVRRMRQHAEEIFTTQGIALTFLAPGEDQDMRLGVDVRRDIFLIFKEALNNASRHARCSRVTVNLRAEGARLSLQVIDDGIGFDASAAGEGQGLSSMRRRAETLGGVCEVQTMPGKGTTIRITMPASVRARAARGLRE